jgi:putative Mg2+ transporter-C (MgtC) family protein
MKYEVHAALLRLFFAFISGGILGFERSAKGISAGFRTHIIVCMASCAIMLTNLYIYLAYHTGDPMRMPAQVISGVGFLGAGCILVTGQHRIKGVTTAAGIWAAACLGLCIGAGDYMVAGIVLLMVILTMTVFRTFDEMIITRTRYMRLFMELSSVHAVTELMRYLQTIRIKVNDTEFLDKKNNEYIAMVIDIELQKSSSVEETIAEFEQVEGVRFVSEI